jgi:signal transduction histidine kinase
VSTVADKGGGQAPDPLPPGRSHAPPPAPRTAEPSLAHVLLHLAVDLVNVALDDVDDAIDRMLATVGALSNSDRAYLWAYDWESRTASQTHEWCAPEVPAVLPQMQCIPLELWPEDAQIHRRGGTSYIPDVAALPAADPLRPWLQDQGTTALINVPLIDDDTCIGFVGFESVRGGQPWSEDEQTLLRMLAQLLVNIRRRQRHEETERKLHAARATNAELERFAAVASHDLRSPLTSVRGFVELVRRKRVTGPEADELLDRAMAAIDRLGGTIEQLLSYAHAGRIVGELEPIELDTAVAPAREALSGPLEARRASVVHGRLDAVRGDAGALEHVFQNLFANALQHVPDDRTPEIRIRTVHLDGWVEVSVADNGIGVPDADRRRVVGAFQQGGDDRERPGVGLGLAICHRIVQAHGGRLWLEGADDGGLDVRFTLPTA